ncbi:MAG: metallophosphoesterase [Myxococcota bacterium]
MVRRGSAKRRLVVVGDLNGADDALIEILRGTGLVDARLRWRGGNAELVQLGDLFNRGGGARRAFNLLMRLEHEARAQGGNVSVLLGNHEVMTALGNEAYCTEQEYLAFASPKERRQWPARVQRAARRIYRTPSKSGRIMPFEPRLEAWKALNAPGQAALRRELGPRGRLGKALRQLRVVHVVDDMVCVHAGILPSFAKLGVAGLNDAAESEWQNAGRRFQELKRRGLFRNPEGPLWDRSLARGGSEMALELKHSLALLGVKRMVIGHTPTHTLKGGAKGRILTRFSNRLVLVDVSLAEGDESPRAALVVENGRGFEWSPEGMRLLWQR